MIQNTASDKALALADQTLNELAAQLEAGCSDALREYLLMLGKFHRYSWRNTMLILAQRPNATYLAGFARWRDLGRWVRKGEKGIVVAAPCAIRREDERTQGNEDEHGPIVGYRAVHIFDLAQTDGAELPSIGTVSGDPGERLTVLRDFVAERGIELAYSDDLGGARGASFGGRIEILRGMEPPEEFSTLVHEIGHELLHRDQRRVETTVQIREVEAESVAFVVTTAVGQPNGTASADYLGLYGGDAKLLAQSLSHIQRVAAEILDRLV